MKVKTGVKVLEDGEQPTPSEQPVKEVQAVKIKEKEPEIPLELLDKISSIKSNKGRVEYSDFEKPLIAITGIPSNNMCYDVEASGMPLQVHDLMMLEAMEDKEVVNSVVTTIIRKYTNIHPDDMLEGDEPYVLMWIRENTFPDSPFIHSFTCNKCNKRHVNKIVGIDNAVFRKLPEWYHTGYYIMIGGTKFKLKPRTRRKVFEKNMYVGSTNKKLDVGDLHVLDMALCIDEPINVAVAMIENMNVSDLPILYQAISVIKGFGFTGRFDVKCEGCGASNLALFRFRKRFYIPEPQGYKLDGDAI